MLYMIQLQRLATDEDKYVNELLEEAAQDLLKKYREKSPKKYAHLLLREVSDLHRVMTNSRCTSPLR